MTMTTNPRLAHTLLPGFMLACVALPGGTAAQSATSTKGPGTLGAAMAEALRSPFHATGLAEAFEIHVPVAVSAPHTGDRPAPDSTARPSFHGVFWPTLAMTYLAHYSGFVLSLCVAYGCIGTISDWAITLMPPVFVPATVARIAGGAFAKSLLGSAVGTGLGVTVQWLMGGKIDSVAYWAVVPPVHAFLTAVLSGR